MRRIHPYSLMVAALLLTRPSSALELHWSSGSAYLTFASATRCTLIVQAEFSQPLPPAWRLLWVADSSGVNFVALDSLAACGADTANVAALEPPTSPADSAANQITARFCSSGNPVALASYVLDQPGGSKGRLKVVALDPADSTKAIESNEVTYNGGVEGDYEAVVLRTSTVHHSTQYLLTAVGSGLAGTRSVSLSAPDGSWSQPLTIAAASDSEVSASASLAAHVPASVLHVQDADGIVTTSNVGADPPPPDLAPADNGGCTRRFEEVLDSNDPYMIQPKDFSFVTGGWTPEGFWAFHLFYIRHNQRSFSRVGPDSTELNIGHQVSNDLANWYWPRSQALDSIAIQTRAGHFDALYVWAPTIVRKGLTYYLFYTGVDQSRNQRIGLATSTDLITWSQGDSVLEATSTPGPRNIPWADPAPGAYSGQAQLRDPFVMMDPDVPGDWLMYFATIPMLYTPEMVVGVARSHGDFESWGDSFPLWNTHHSWPNPTTTPPADRSSLNPRTRSIATGAGGYLTP